MNVSMTGYHSRCFILSIIHLPRFLKIYNAAQDGPAYVSRHKKGTLQTRPPCAWRGKQTQFQKYTLSTMDRSVHDCCTTW